MISETADTDYQEILEVSHPTKDLADFQDDWDSATKAALGARDLAAYDSTVEAVHAELRKNGWSVEEVTSHGTYMVPLPDTPALDPEPPEPPKEIQYMTPSTHVKRMLVACRNAAGEPDFFPCRVAPATEGVVMDDLAVRQAAAKDAELQDYAAPYTVYDCDCDPAGIAVCAAFNWDDSSLITLASSGEEDRT